MFDSLLSRITSPTVARRRGFNIDFSAATYDEPDFLRHSTSTDGLHNEVVFAESSVDDRVAALDTTIAGGARKPRPLERRKKSSSGRRVNGYFENGLRQARSLGRLDGIKEVEKLADYGKLLVRPHSALCTGRRKDLNRIQDMFPYDNLDLHVAEPNTFHETPRKLFSKRSDTLNQFTPAAITATTEFEASKFCNRVFLMESPCAISLPTGGAGPQNAKARHLFLFSDMLLIAKPKSNVYYKLKDRIRLSELWMAPCVDSETGFLLGWPQPTRTYFFTFATQAARDSWWRQLQRALQLQLYLEPATTNIKVLFREVAAAGGGGVECAKTLTIRAEMSASQVARLVCQEAHFATPASAYTLYVRETSCCGGGGGDAKTVSLCALSGYERPHAIQLARLRRSLCADAGFDLVRCNNSNHIPNDCYFELKPVQTSTVGATGISSHRNMFRPPLKLFLRRSNSTPQQLQRIFGVPLPKLFATNGGHLPATILTVLRTLYALGPGTQGIFRRCASARALRELRDKIDTLSGADEICEQITNAPVLLLAALLKDFLRNLGEPLLAGDVHAWLKAPNHTASTEYLLRLVKRLPPENHTLLAHVLCVLSAIAKRSKFNMMSANNLGVCVGPSLLWESAQNGPMRTLPALIEMLINNCQQLFGTQVLGTLYHNNGTTQDSQVSANDSGAEESDSLNSVGLSVEPTSSSTSSSTQLYKDQKSLSRDSGLTLSEDDRDSPGFAPTTLKITTTAANGGEVGVAGTVPPVPPTFHRSDWTRQASRIRGLLEVNNNGGGGGGGGSLGPAPHPHPPPSPPPPTVVVKATAPSGGGGHSNWLRLNEDEAAFCTTSSDSLYSNGRLRPAPTRYYEEEASAPPLPPPPLPRRHLLSPPPLQHYPHQSHRYHHHPPPPVYRPPPPPPPPQSSALYGSTVGGTATSAMSPSTTTTPTKFRFSNNSMSDVESESYV